MRIFYRTSFYAVAVAALLLAWAGEGHAQVTLSSLSLTYGGNSVDTVVRGDQGDMYDFCVTASSGSVAGIAVDIKYSINGVNQGWVTTSALDGNGCVTLQTSMQSPIGMYNFERIRDNNGGNPGPELVTNRYLNVLENIVGLSLNSSSGFAGESTLVVSVPSAPNNWGTDIQVKYTWDGQEQTGYLWINYQGQASIGPLDHYLTGHFVYLAVQHAYAQPHNWTSLSSPTYDVYPPQPLSIDLTKTSIVAGATNGDQNYRIWVENGANVTLNTKYRFPVTSGDVLLWGFPSLSADGGSWHGISGDISATKCTVPGARRYTYGQNLINYAFGLDNHWRGPYNKDITVTYSGAPTVSMPSPNWGSKSQNVVVTLTGQNLCGVSFSTTHPGLTFTNVEYPGYSNPEASNGTSVRATFQIASNATVGNAPITLNARDGSVIFYFGITDTGSPPAPTITGVSPGNGLRGTSPSVTISGTNLINPTLTPNWSGLTFTNVVPNANGTSVTATFNINASAALGSPPIKLTASGTDVTTTLFSIVNTLPVFLTREYIYLGDRVIAVEAP
jgi:hypothetical protein